LLDEKRTVLEEKQTAFENEKTLLEVLTVTSLTDLEPIKGIEE
jgi:hypothetical protein